MDNNEIRLWYQKKCEALGDELDKIIERISQYAYKKRKEFKIEARGYMSDSDRQKLNEERPIPSFEELLQLKMELKQMTKRDALIDIIFTASKTNAEFDRRYGNAK